MFECGATKVLVWDNHGGGGNIDFSLIDPRAERIAPDNKLSRMSFLKEYNVAAILFLGYHCKDGTVNGVSAENKLVKFTFPCEFEVRYTRMEMAAWQLERLGGVIPTLRYGEDAHILKATLRNLDDLRSFL